MPGGEKLSRYQDAAIAALLVEPTIAGAASKAGVNERTLRRWLADCPEFISEYRAARRHAVEVAISQLQQATTEAVETLRRNLRCGSRHAEIRAAVAILDYAVKGVEIIDLEERLEEVEEYMTRERRRGRAPQEA